MNILFVFFGGGLGCVLRYLIGIGIQRNDVSLPLATLFANVIACLIFSATLWWIQTRTPDNNESIRLLLLTGFCGGLSTFSTFGYETFMLFKQQFFLTAILNIVLSVSLCISAFLIVNNLTGK